MMPTPAHEKEIVSWVALESLVPHEAQIRIDATAENSPCINFIVRKDENTWIWA
jgi:hypothetical protein